jgi:predicted dehydrogenase
MSNLKICVVGLGAMGGLHLSKLTGIKNLEVYGIDSDIEKIKEAEKKFHVPVFQKIEDVMGKINAAVISTPTITHYVLGRKLLSNGVHIFVEKPLAENVRNAKELCKLARKNRCILQVGHIERFNPAFCRLKKFVTKPNMLTFYRMSPFPKRSLDIDAVMDLMIHDIDLALNMVKSDVKKVEAYGYRFVSEKPDIVVAKIIFSNDCIVNFISNRVYTHKVRKICVLEKGKYIIADLLNIKILNISAGDYSTIEHEIIPEPYDMIEAELRAFIKSIKSKSEPVVSGEDGVRAIDIAEQIQQKMLS